MIQNAFVVGATGKLGKEVVRQIIDLRDNDPSIHFNPTRIVGLASRRSGAIYNPYGIDNRTAIDFSQGKITRRSFRAAADLIRMVSEPTVFIDLTASGDEMLDFDREVIFETKEHSIVTANKLPLTICTFEEFQKLTYDHERFGFSCSVMAGAGTVDWLRNCGDLGDRVIKIEGCFSGTLGYVTTELAKGRKISEIFREAFERGYTEPHPRDDADGKDPERKGVILARAAGIDIKPYNIDRIPFLPPAYLGEEDIGKFFDNLVHLDNIFYSRMDRKIEEGLSLKYVVTILNKPEGATLKVRPMFLKRFSPLGSLEGTANKVVITTEIYKNSWSVEATGAGIEITARNVRADLLNRLRGRKGIGGKLV